MRVIENTDVLLLNVPMDRTSRKRSAMSGICSMPPLGSLYILYKGIADSEAAGIAIIYQELALIPELSVYENIYFGHEIKKGMTVNWNETIVKAEEMLRQVGLDINPAMKVKNLSVGKQQLVEIAKALSKNVSSDSSPR